MYGKGIWLRYSHHLDIALEMAREIGGTHLIFRTGHETMFFPAAVYRVCERARTAGLIPLAWLDALRADPADEARLARKSVEAGCLGVVLNVDDTADGPERAELLGQHLLEAGLNPDVLFYSAPPAVSRHPNVPYAELNAFCLGGFMPRSTPLTGKPPEVTIHKMTYEEHRRWSKTWNYTPPLYPVLAAFRDHEGADFLTPTEFAGWITALAEHHPTFFSIFHAAATPRDLWPLIADVSVPRPPHPPTTAPLLEPGLPTHPEAPEEAAEPTGEPLIVTVGVSDTVWTLCEQYGCTREQFWEWNGHLWDERGWPRDANYLQPGWRIRVR